MLWHLSADIMCSVSFKELQGQISEHISLPNGDYRVSIYFKYFTQRAQFWKLGDILGYPPVLAGGYSVTWRV